MKPLIRDVDIYETTKWNVQRHISPKVQDLVYDKMGNLEMSSCDLVIETIENELNRLHK